MARAHPLYDADAVLKGPFVANVPACLLMENGNVNEYFSVIVNIIIVIEFVKKYTCCCDYC